MSRLTDLSQTIATKTLHEWTQIFETEPDIFWSQINSLDDDTTTAMIAAPADFGATPVQPRSGATKLGEYSEEIGAERRGAG